MAKKEGWGKGKKKVERGIKVGDTLGGQRILLYSLLLALNPTHVFSSNFLFLRRLHAQRGVGTSL